MSIKNIEYNENSSSGVVTLSIPAATTGDYSWVWSTFNTSTKVIDNIFWFQRGISDMVSIKKKNISTGVISTTIEFSAATWANIMSMCINKTQDKIYAFIPITSRNRFLEIQISDMSVINNYEDITNSNHYIYKTIIDKKDIIWFQGTNNRLYRMNQDTTNLAHVSTKGRTDGGTFAPTLDTEVFILSSFTTNSSIGGTSIISKTFINEVDSMVYDEYDGLKMDLQWHNSEDSFALGDNLYFISIRTISFESVKLVKIPKATWDNSSTWVIRDITTDFGILPNVTQFFTDGVYGYFYENNLTTRKYFWRVDLSNLSCIQLCTYNLPSSEFIWNRGSDTPQEIVCTPGSSGCDPAAFLLGGLGATGGA